MSRLKIPQEKSVLLPAIDNPLCSEIPKPEWWDSFLYEDDGRFTDAYKEQLRANNIIEEKIEDLEIDNINRLRKYQKSELSYFNTYRKWRSTSESMLPDEDDYVGREEWEFEQMDDW